MRIRPIIATALLAMASIATAAPAAAAIEATTRAVPAASAGEGVAGSTGDFTVASFTVASFTVASFTGDYYLSRDDERHSTLRTVERLVAEFPDTDQNHGIERILPTSYDDVDLHLRVTSVTDAAGTPVHFTRNDTDDGYTTLRIGDADRYVHGTQTYVIGYTMRDVVRSFSNTKSDELYWNINGTGWRQPFGKITARVHLQPALVPALTGNQACYRGAQGSTDRCPITRVGDTVTASTGHLGPYENMTVAIGFAPSTFATPAILKDSWLFTVVPWLLVGLAVALAAAALWVRTTRWRDAPGRPTIIAEYAPPKNMHPALAAELLHRRKTGLSAQIVDFAVNKVVRIREFPHAPKAKRYELEFLLENELAVPMPQRSIIQALFGRVKKGRTLLLDRADRTLGDRLAKHRGDEMARVASLKLRAKPVSRVPKRVAWAAVILSIASIGYSWLADALKASSGWLVLTVVLVVALSVLACIFASPPFRLTEDGAELRDHLRGLRVYIRLAEADRIRMLQAPSTAERIDVTDRSAVIALYEKLLPYAIIWGIEKQWIGELEHDYAVTAAPDWYEGTGDLAGIAMLSGISSGSFATTPAPGGSGSSSSSSGGSSGGGFSGGGGGGGGGGGW